MEKIDYVLTYVDNTDPEWIEQNIKVSARFGRKYIPNGVRYRDWGTLRYVFRGLEENMPWINNVYIIVERPTQVPVWLNTNTVKVIYHNQIIPKQFLPTYNSNSIELFMYRIPTLSERFIYGNDDIFPTNPLAPEDFFTENGKVKIKIRSSKYVGEQNIYRQSLKTTENFVRDAFGQPHIQYRVMRGDHSIYPMLKSVWAKIWEEHKERIERSITTFRQKTNITQEVSNFWNFLSGNSVSHSRKNKYFNFTNKSAVELRPFLFSKDVQVLCMNDGGVVNYAESRKIVNALFKERFPKKSKYEK